MKNTFLSIVLLFCVFVGADAQEKHYPKRDSYVQEQQYREPRRDYRRTPPRRMPDLFDVNLHAVGSLGLKDLGRVFSHEYPSQFSLGSMLELRGRKIGVGVGAEVYGSANFDAPSGFDEEQYLYSFPVYANLRLTSSGFLFDKFIEGRLGYSIPLSSIQAVSLNGSSINSLQANGLYGSLGIGLSFLHSNLSLGFTAIDLTATSFTHYTPYVYDIMFDVYLRYSYAFRLLD